MGSTEQPPAARSASAAIQAANVASELAVTSRELGHAESANMHAKAAVVAANAGDEHSAAAHASAAESHARAVSATAGPSSKSAENVTEAESVALEAIQDATAAAEAALTQDELQHAASANEHAVAAIGAANNGDAHRANLHTFEAANQAQAAGAAILPRLVPSRAGLFSKTVGQNGRVMHWKSVAKRRKGKVVKKAWSWVHSTKQAYNADSVRKSRM